VIPKRIILKVKINRAVIRSDNINLKELNKGEDKKLQKGRAKCESGD